MCLLLRLIQGYCKPQGLHSFQWAWARNYLMKTTAWVSQKLIIARVYEYLGALRLRGITYWETTEWRVAETASRRNGPNTASPGHRRGIEPRKLLHQHTNLNSNYSFRYNSHCISRYSFRYNFPLKLATLLFIPPQWFSVTVSFKWN